VFYPSRGEAVGQVTDSEEIKSERFLFCNLCNIIDPMAMHILAHLYFGDLMRRVFCILDMFIIQNKDIARLSGLIRFGSLSVSDKEAPYMLV
jgi:hypothetical protein